MRKKFTSFLSLSLLALCTALPTTASAETINQYDPDYVPDFVKEAVEEGDEFYIDSDILSDLMYYIELVRPPESKEGDITIRMSNVGSVSGCLKVTQPTIETERVGRIMKVELTEGRITPDDDDRRYSQHECEIRSSASYADAVLKRDELINNKVERVVISTKIMGEFVNMKLTIDKEKALLITGIQDNMEVANAGMLNGRNKDIYWFYPENTIILYSPSIKIDDDSAKKMSKFARSRGLIPLTDIYPDFRTTEENRHKMYFVDVDGAYAHQLVEANDTFTLGNVEFNELYHGPEGPYEKPVTKPVYVKHPGLYE